MEPLRLYINDFMCYNNTYIDLSSITSAIVIGRVNNNDLYSNAVGKSTIFKAIEYALFNYNSEGLDSIVRDDADACSIVFDFAIDGKEYRVSRKRTKKGTTDLSLFERNAKDVGSADANHSLDAENEIYTPNNSQEYWNDISGRRASDTEKDLEKITKINLKLFRIFVHFVQNDFSGLTTATPEKRKAILKDALNLVIYSKLEKLAKEEASKLSKEIDKNTILIDSLEQQNDQSIDYNQIISLAEQELKNVQKNIASQRDAIVKCNTVINASQEKVKTLESGSLALLKEQQDMDLALTRLKSSHADILSKKNNAVKVAKALIAELKELEIKKDNLNKNDFSILESLNKNLNEKERKITELNFAIKSAQALVIELKLPLPDENYCKHCRQQLSDEHRKICQETNDKEIENNNLLIKNNKSQILTLNEECKILQSKLDNLNNLQKQLEITIFTINSKSKELEDKKNIYNEYSLLVESASKEIESKERMKKLVDDKIKASSSHEIESIKREILNNMDFLKDLNKEYDQSKNTIDKLSNEKAIATHNLEKRNAANIKITEMKDNNKVMQENYSVYPEVIRSFSSTGIPNIIIHSVLDMLQTEANNLLDSLKPGIQLTFEVEKIDSDGNEAETLNIIYHDNGRKRNFGQLSGAQQFVVSFSLKLGLSFLLQKLTGVNVKFLLLDEVDQALDKASVDAFSDIVKFFQDEYKIIVITHNDRLKDKFNTAILVNQDLNKISKAKMVSSW